MEWNAQLKREIPQGWIVKKLGDICKFNNGINYDKDVYGDKTYRIINVRNISSSSLIINEQDLDEINLPSNLAENFLIDNNSILIARSGTPGATRIIENATSCIYCGFIIKCMPCANIYRLYLTYMLKQYEGTTLTQTGGSILQNVSQETLKSIKLYIPTDTILMEFNNLLNPLIAKIHNNMNQINALIKQRDEILPLLMNGQVNSDLSAY